jgi:amino acid adenylation domain-containing protein
MESAENENYWLDRLADPPIPFDLPSDRVRPALKTYSAATERLELDEKTTAEWRKASARFGSNLFSFLLAGLSVLIHRLSGATDFVVGIPAADQSTTSGMRAKGDRHLVGDYVNLLPIRIECDTTRPFGEHLDKLRRLVMDGYEHQNFTYGELLSKLKLPRDPSRVPLVPVVFNIDREAHGVSLADLTVDISSPPKTFDFFDLRLNVTDAGSRLFADLTFNVDLFDREAVRRWLAYWKTLLDAAGSNDSLTLLPLLDAEQRKQVAQDWNQAARALPPGNVCEWFEEHAKRTPGAVAAEDDQGPLTYSELDARASSLARRLKGNGAGPDVPVAIYMERSLDMLTAVLAILKSGSAYLPLDPAYPETRLRFMIENSGARVVLRNASTRNGLQFPTLKTIEADEGTGPADDSFEALPAWTAPSPGDLAYILYTSGSTGSPKGVGVSHAALSNLIAAMRNEINLSDHDILMAVSPLTFDIATLEFLLPLVSGARAVIASRDTASDGRILLEALRARGATIMQATPATWRMLIDVGWNGQPALKVLCGGEAMTPLLAGQLIERSDAVWNLYGPTEATIWALGYALHSSSLQAHTRIPIGRPLANMQAYVLDAHFQLVPPGVTGEIFLGGTSLARGYIARPDLDRERFLEIIVNGMPLRLYRTGDLGKFRSDGVLECIGREDGQIKLRGFRVELGEVSSILTQHPDIATATAALHGTGDAAAISAYFVTKAARTPAVEDLRAWLATRLPGYMIPTTLLRLDAMPLTPNGKVDVRGLPRERPAYQEESSGGWDITEFRLLKLWEELFGAQLFTAGNGSTTRSFFDVGGDSLLAVRFLTRVERTFGVRVTLRELFEGPTIEKLAVRLREPGSTPMPSSVLVMQPGGSQTPLFFIDAYAVHLPLIAALGVDRPIVVVTSLKENVPMDETLDVAMIARALVESIQSFRPAGPYVLAGWSASGLIAYETAQQLRRLGQEVEMVVLLDVANPDGLPKRSQHLHDKIRFHFKQLRELPRTERFQYLKERGDHLVIRGQRIAGALHADMAVKTSQDPHTLSLNQRVAFVMRAVSRYKPVPYDGPGLLIRCERYMDVDFGWQGILGEAFETIETAGTHDTMLKEPHVKGIAQEIAKRLNVQVEV